MGMDDHTFVRNALQAWSSVIDVVDLTPMPRVTNSLWRVETTGARSYVLKLLPEYPPGASPVEEFRVLCHLQQSGIPVALPVVSDEGQIHVGVGDRLVALLPLLPASSETYEVREDASDVALGIGRAIGQLDEALASCPWAINSFVDEPGDIPESALPGLPDEVKSLVESLVPQLTAPMADLPTQLTHGDCNHGNVLVDNGTVTGFLDLDHLPVGPRVRDLVSYVVSRLRGHLSHPRTTDRVATAMVGLLGSYVDGYRSANPLTPAEIRAVVPMMLLVEIAGANWCLHGWVRDLDKYRDHETSIRWIVDHFDQMCEQLIP